VLQAPRFCVVRATSWTNCGQRCRLPPAAGRRGRTRTLLLAGGGLRRKGCFSKDVAVVRLRRRRDIARGGLQNRNARFDSWVPRSTREADYPANTLSLLDFGEAPKLRLKPLKTA